MSAIARSFDALFKTSSAGAAARVPPSTAAHDFSIALAATSSGKGFSVERSADGRHNAAAAKAAASSAKRRGQPLRNTDEKSTPPTKRRSFNKLDQISLGQEALEMRRQILCTTGTCRGWLNAFLTERFEIEDSTCEGARALRNQIKGAVRSVRTGNVERPALRGRKKKLLAQHNPSQAAPTGVGGGATCLGSGNRRGVMVLVCGPFA